MACQGSSPIVTFEQDLPVVTFEVTEGGKPMRLYNYAPTLYVVHSDGTPVTSFGLEIISDGLLTFTEHQNEALSAMVPGTNYKAQIYLEAVQAAVEGEIGLYDIINPYWADYVPSLDHIPGWFSGEATHSQTILTSFTWVVREAFKLRGN